MLRSSVFNKTCALSFLLTASFLAGCGSSDDEGDSNPTPNACGSVPNACATVGERICSDDAASVLVCKLNSDGCAVWSTERPCGDNATCVDAACSCNNECDTAGLDRCSGDVVETCAMDAVGCLGWQTVTNCADSSQQCVLTGNDATCEGGCTDGCPAENDLRCQGDLLQSCDMGTDGCLHWITSQDCGADSLVCDDTGATPACVESCQDTCPSEGDMQCEGDAIETCSMGTDGCLAWETTTNCADNDPPQTCDASGTVPVCADSCSDACPTEGDLQCAGDQIQTCTMGANGCLDWETTTNCADNTPAETCDDSGAEPVCVSSCQDTCPAEDDVQCNGDVIETCTMGAEGCLAWETTEDCSTNTPAQTCSDAGGAPACVDGCQDTCPAENDEQCNGDVIETCTMGANGCLAWETTTDCSTSTPAQTCSDAGGAPACVDGCQDACPAENDLQCSGDLLQTCTMGASGCLAWETTTDCSANTPAQICDDGGATPVCADPPANGTCSDPQIIGSLPFQVAGVDFPNDYTNDHDFSSTTDCGTANGSEAVFQITLTAGQTIRIRETASLDAVIRVLDVCDETTGTCLLSSDTPEDVVFTAPADGDYYIVLEAWNSAPNDVTWDFMVEEVAPPQGIFELFDSTNPADLEGCTV
ncbi:MAG: PPC domain-containing protein, partial [Myxococcota bacterium]